jgi:hypothetical protein
MRKYQSFEDIEQDLKRLNLERNIAWEEIKLSKNKFRNDLKQKNWLSMIVDVAGKYGFYMLLKRFLK